MFKIIYIRPRNKKNVYYLLKFYSSQLVKYRKIKIGEVQSSTVQIPFSDGDLTSGKTDLTSGNIEMTLGKTEMTSTSQSF